MYPFIALLFTPVALALWFALIAAAALTLAANADAAVASLGDALTLSGETALTLAAIFILLKIVHEFGHAAAYRFFCGREGLATGPIMAGICFFAFAPFPFTNVSGAWRIADRRRRAAIGAAGVYVETWLAAGAVLLWASLSPGEFRTAALQLALVSGGSTLLFNLNPLVRLDGYFIFTDIFGFRNLGTRAAVASRSLTGWAFGAPWRRISWGHLAYSLGSYAYRWVIFGGVFWLAYAVDPRLAVPVAIISLSLLVVRPLITSLRAAAATGFGVRGAATVVLLVAAAAAAALVPAPDWTVAEAEVERWRETPVFPPAPARVAFVAGDGAAGLALRLDDPALQAEEAEAELSLQRAAIAIRAAAGRPEIVAQLQEEAGAVAARIDRLAARRADLVVTAEDGAVWTPLDARSLSGAWVAPPSRPLGMISRPRAPVVSARIAQDALSGLDLSDGATVAARAWHDPDCAFSVHAERLSEVAGAGAFLLEARIDDDAPACAAALPHGAAVALRLDRPPAPVGVQLWRGALRLAQARLPISAQP